MRHRWRSSRCPSPRRTLPNVASAPNKSSGFGAAPSIQTVAPSATARRPRPAGSRNVSPLARRTGSRQCAQRQPEQRESQSGVGEVERALAFGKAGKEARARVAVGDERDDERDGRTSHAQMLKPVPPHYRLMPVPPHYRLMPVPPHYRLIIVQRMSVMSASWYRPPTRPQPVRAARAPERHRVLEVVGRVVHDHRPASQRLRHAERGRQRRREHRGLQAERVGVRDPQRVVSPRTLSTGTTGPNDSSRATSMSSVTPSSTVNS